MGFREEISKLHRETVQSDKIYFRIIDLMSLSVESDEEFVIRMGGNPEYALVVRAEV